MLLDDKKSTQKTHYDTLSVKEDVSYEEIRASYRSAVLNSHPDKLQGVIDASSSQQESQERFLEVQKAWEILSDSKSRSAYDRELRDSRRDTEFADDVKLEEMSMEDVGEAVELFYQCRCGDYFSIDSSELGEMGYSLATDGNIALSQRPAAIPASVILPCGSCSLKIRLLIASNGSSVYGWQNMEEKLLGISIASMSRGVSCLVKKYVLASKVGSDYSGIISVPVCWNECILNALKLNDSQQAAPHGARSVKLAYICKEHKGSRWDERAACSSRGAKE